jgi:putative hemolysin
LYGDKYNKAEGNYYEDHIKALKNVGILTNDNPSIEEVRGWVMLMMLRSTNVKAESEESTGAVVGIANPASVYCEEQGGTLTIVEDKEGNQSGMCKLADGTEVEEWEYFRANHKEEVEAAS